MVQRTILLVEDDAPVRQLFVRALAAAGYRVYEARNGEEAIDCFEKHGPEVDLLITDMKMPHVSGDAVVNELRRREQHLKVLCVSAYRTSMNIGCDRFLVKPFTNAEFLSAVRDLIATAEPTPQG